MNKSCDIDTSQRIQDCTGDYHITLLGFLVKLGFLEICDYLVTLRLLSHVHLVLLNPALTASAKSPAIYNQPFS